MSEYHDGGEFTGNTETAGSSLETPRRRGVHRKHRDGGSSPEIPMAVARRDAGYRDGGGFAGCNETFGRSPTTIIAGLVIVVTYCTLYHYLWWEN